MNLYFVLIGNKLFSTTINPSVNGESRTCLIGLTNYRHATKLRNHIIHSQTPLQNVNYHDIITLEKLDYTSTYFKKMVKVNNFALMLAHDFFINDATGDYEFKGSTLVPDYTVDSQMIQHLNHLLDDNSLNEV
jgi:hypothetical protein